MLFFPSDFLCNIHFFLPCFFFFFFILKIMTTGTCLLFLFFSEFLIYFNLDVLCKKKSILWGKHLKKYMHIYTVHTYVQMYICV